MAQMTPENFICWLQGYLESPGAMSPEQVDVIRKKVAEINYNVNYTPATPQWVPSLSQPFDPLLPYKVTC